MELYLLYNRFSGKIEEKAETEKTNNSKETEKTEAKTETKKSEKNEKTEKSEKQENVTDFRGEIPVTENIEEKINTLENNVTEAFEKYEYSMGAAAGSIMFIILYLRAFCSLQVLPLQILRDHRNSRTPESLHQDLFL